jgi:hypothetical protein
LVVDLEVISKYNSFIDNFEWLMGGPIAHIINPSISESMMRLHPETKKLREDLFKKHDKELKAGNTILAAQIEKQLCDHAWQKLVEANDPSIDIYLSDCGISFANNFKTSFIMKGPVIDNTDPDGMKYNIITTNLNEGISKDDFIYMADSGVLGAYSVGMATGISGYYTKKYNALFQDITLLPKGSDCGSTKTIKVTITPKNSGIWGKYHYHMVKGKPELITPDTVSKYIGKTLDMRTPMGCEAKKPHICNKCYGDLSYMLGKLNVGKTYSVIPNTMMNADLKKKHDTTVKLGVIDIDGINAKLKQRP